MDGVEQLTATSTFPLTDLQEAYLVGATRLVELGGVRPTFYLELDVPGLDLHRLERAVDLLIAQHDQLRSEVLPEGSQRVLPPDRIRPYRLVVTDLVGLDPDRQQQALRRTRERMAEHGVEPTGWPLFELKVSRLRRHRARVHVAMSLLLLDGRSIRQIWREFQALYRDPDASLATSPLTVQECRLDQLAEEHTTAYAAQWRYWADRLDSLPEAPRLPLARRSVEQVRFTRRTCHLTTAEWRRLSATVRGHRLTATAALLHLFAETLATWAASPRFCLTVLHQGWVSEHPEAAGVVGQFGSTLPLEVSGEGDFWERGRGTQTQLWRDLQHSAVSGVRIAREVAARRGRAPHASLPYVFTSMLEPSGAPEQIGCRTVYSSLRTPQVLIDNQLVDADDGGIDCVWDVVDEAFPPGLPDLMFAAYQTMIRTLAGPDGAHTVPDPVPAGHRARTAALNDITRDIGKPVPAGRLEDGFLRQAAAHPDATAVVTPIHTLTYGQLHAASAAVAGLLRSHGVGSGDVVPVVMTKGWEQVVAVLGVLRAGAAYCPIDAGLPAERIRALLGEVSARVALGQSYTAVDFGVPDIAILPVDQWEAADSPPDLVVEGGELAYIIYTSGSTGRPKGVMIEHRACLNTVLDINDRIGLHAGDRVFGISSLSFDLSVWDVFGTLAAGATLVLPAAGTRPDPVGWTAAAARHGVTVWNSVPALAQLLVETVARRPELGRPPIRVFLLSGDWVPLLLPDLIGRAWPGTRLLALGGATEASIWSNFYEVGEVAPGWASIPYGTPLRNQTMRILDDRMELRAPWAEGGIYIGGAGLARGYWQDEQRTAARFVDHPSTGERLYRTGDLGRYWPDGTIEFLGRADRQLKIQGFRVEPGEVEAALCEHPAVDTCVVGVEQVPGGQQRLVGLVVPASGEAPAGAALTEHLRTRLPGYMVPARILVVPALPLTANGKVDVGRAMATLVDAATPATRPTPARPATTDDDELVQRLCRIWADLLGRPEVAADDDVFVLGGTSLLLLRLINQIRAELGADVPFGQLFETPTIRALAARIGPQAAASDRADAQDRGGACAVELADRPGPPLVLFHPVGGAVTSYLPLAGAWPGPVRAFQSRGLTGRHPGTGADLTAMAAGYRSELQRLTTAGDFLIGGWSMGGVLAHEVGRQLTAAGAQCRVVMIDSPPAFPASPDEPAAAHLDFLHDLGGGRTRAPTADQIRRATAEEMASTALRVAVEHDLLPITADVAAYTRLQTVHAHNTRLLAAYRPGPSTSPTLLIVASGSTDAAAAAAGWRAVCPQLTVRTLPADHYSVMSSGRAATLVAVITEWLASAGASTEPSDL